MVKHIVLWKIKDDENKQNNIDHMIKILTGLVGKIDGLVSAEMGYNFNTDSDYDVVLYATLKNAVALKYYQNHPEHLKCKEFIGKIAVDRVAADYFFEEEISAVKSFDEVPDAPDETVVNDNVSVAPNKLPLTATPTPIVDSIPVEPASASGVDSAPVEMPKKENGKSFFKKKNDDIQITPVEQRAGSWTCPNCGKIMPDYVGTCGCGEPKPFENTFNSNDISSAPNNEPVSAPVQTVKPASVSAPVEMPKKENGKSFFKKKNDDIQITPVEQRAGSWTCPNCGKVMPDYVGTCGCGEPKPFDNVHFTQNYTAVTSNNIQTDVPKAESVNKSSKPFFSKNTVEKQPLNIDTAQNSDTWICPKCGKILPNYVGTCGCGEPKPFENFSKYNDISINHLSSESNLPDIQQKENSQNSNATPIYKINEKFASVEPSLQSYNPQVKNTEPQTMQQQDLDFIKNDKEQETNVNNNFNAQDLSFIKSSENSLDESKPYAENQTILEQPKKTSIDELDSPMKFTDADETQENAEPVQSFSFDNVPPPAPMRFNDAPPASLHLNDTENLSPVNNNNVQPSPINYNAPTIRQNISPVFSNTDVPQVKHEKYEKKHRFGKKAKEEAVIQKAVQAVSERKDIPSNTWTCPNCGKVMPKYVGTCGCGEQQPFDD